jgi:hypothetical protein
MTREDVERIKNLSIADYLSSRGINFEPRGSKLYCKSPFSYDNTPSFCLYPNNTFYDWANGFGGDIIKLVMEMEGLNFVEALNFLNNGEFSSIDISSTLIQHPKEEFKLEPFLKVTKEESVLIRSYALKRAIYQNFALSRFIIKDGEDFVRRPSVGFLHVDENMEVCGIKMRDIAPYKGQRFSARGQQKFYLLTNDRRDSSSIANECYIVESESSANSLLEFLSICRKKAYVVSFGSWSNVPKELPEILSSTKKKSIIIDYDGNEELYQERIAKFGHLDAKELKLELPKSEDINSLFISGKIYKYKQLLIN